MSELIGQRLGQYEIISLLGKGGMATVYRAHQLNIKRDVALKVIKPELAETGDFIKRFEREAETIASLSHPHILKLFDYGEHSDTVYLVMELLTGGSLADVIRVSPLKLDYSARIFDQIAEALDYAHQQGIIHRDLKPQNVLLDRMGNAFLTDFGIAKLVNATMNLTQTGLAMGTPAYMPPEQWRGEPVDARSDIYSLGVMLFEMLSGRLPFNGDTPFKVMHQHVYEELPPLRTFRPDVPGGVEAVLKTAMAKDREARYQSATQFAAAFRASLSTPIASQAVPTRPRPTEDRTIPEGYAAAPPPSKPSIPSPAGTGRGMPPTPPVNGGTFVASGELPAATLTPQGQRSSPLPIIIGALAAVIVVGVLAVFILPKLLNPSSGAATPTSSALIAAAATTQSAQTQVAAQAASSTAGVSNLTPLYVAATSTPTVVPTAQSLTTLSPTDTAAPTDIPPSARPIIVAAAPTDTVAPTEVPTDVPTDIPTEVPTTVPAPVTATSLPTDTTEPPTETPAPTDTIAPSDTVEPSTTDTLAPTTTNPPAITATPATALEVTSVVGDVDAHSYYGLCPKVFTFTGQIDANAAGTVTYRWERSDASTAPTESVNFSEAGSQTVTTQWSLSRTPFAGWVVLHVLTPTDLSSEKISFTLTCDTSGPTATLPKLVPINATTAPNATGLGTLVANLPTGQLGGDVMKYVGHQGPVYSGAFSPDGKQILTGGFDKTARLWDVATGKQIQQFKGHLNWVSSVAFSPDGTKIATGSWDTTAKIWDVQSGKELITLSGHTQPVTDVAFTPDGTQIFTVSADHTARLWDLATGKQIYQGNSPSQKAYYSVAVSPDGKLVAGSGADNNAQVYDEATGKLIQQFVGHSAPVFSVAWSPDGQTIATASDDKTARLWDVTTSKSLSVFTGHKDFVRSVAISPDGTTLLTGSGDATAILWDIASGKVLYTFTQHTGAVVGVKFSPDGSKALTVGDDGLAYTWDVK